jgi:hypothetical protein
MKQKMKFLFFGHETESKEKTEEGQRAATPWGGAAYPWLAPPGGVDPWSTP